MWTPLFYTVGFAVGFFLYLQFVRYEERRGSRLFLSHFRHWLDRMIVRFGDRVDRLVRYVTRYIITLSWYYSLHAFLKLVLQFIAGIYHVIEAVLIKNRDRARALRRERRQSQSHLTAIAEHKAEVKLTPAEAKKRKDKALKGHRES